MQALKAHVHNGRLVLDEPTDLPEGREVELVPVDALGEMSPEQRSELQAELEASITEMESGQGRDAFEFLAELRNMR
jgi:hypothetical protein